MDFLANYSSDSDNDSQREGEENTAAASIGVNTKLPTVEAPAAGDTNSVGQCGASKPDSSSLTKEFARDYVADKCRNSSLTKVQPSTQFEQIANSVSPQAGWTEQLKRQREFSNPHFFESVIERFGLSESVDSHSSAEAFSTWETEATLMRLEEAARISAHRGQ